MAKILKSTRMMCFCLTELIDPSDKINVSKGVYDDIQEFVKCMLTENVDVKQLGLVERNKEQILEEIRGMYQLVQ